MAASRAGLDTVIMPKRNEPDLDDLPDEVRQKIRLRDGGVCVRCFSGALEPPAALAHTQNRHGKAIIQP
ncbi:S16 family serine protease [Candidatus Amarolinea dominans]|uniref:S16 family serine protease n=1 Tax=Candidatus Amarolinea dominans TaxID=3140696 RepID=UPI0031CC7E53